MAPGNQTEQLLVDIWKDFFGFDRIGIHDNFFDLGATSLDLVQLNSRLKETFGKEMPIERMFSYPTISILAKYLDQNQRGLNQGTCDEEMERTEVLARGKNRLKQRKKNIKETHNG